MLKNYYFKFNLFIVLFLSKVSKYKPTILFVVKIILALLHILQVPSSNFVSTSLDLVSIFLSII